MKRRRPCLEGLLSWGEWPAASARAVCPKAADLCLTAFGPSLWIVADNDRDKPKTHKSHDIGLREAQKAAAPSAAEGQVKGVHARRPWNRFCETAGSASQLPASTWGRCSKDRMLPSIEPQPDDMS